MTKKSKVKSIKNSIKKSTLEMSLDMSGCGASVEQVYGGEKRAFGQDVNSKEDDDDDGYLNDYIHETGTGNDAEDLSGLMFLVQGNTASWSTQKNNKNIGGERKRDSSGKINVDHDLGGSDQSSSESSSVDFEEEYLARSAAAERDDDDDRGDQINNNQKSGSKLPTKTRDGKLVFNGAENEAKNTPSLQLKKKKLELENKAKAAKQASLQEEEKQANDAIIHAAAKAKAKPTPPSTDTEKQALTLNKVKEEIARISSLITEEPEKHLSTEIKALFTLLTRCKDAKSQFSSSGCKVILLSMASIFLDIIPGYRIVKIANEDKTQISKEVRKLRDFEDKLLSSYQHYLAQLEKYTNQSRDASLRHASLYCMTRLLTVHTHFNYSLNVMTVVVENMANQSTPETSKICCEAISTVFKQDESGSASLECVKLISDMIYTRKFTAMPIVLETLHHLRLHKELSVSSLGGKKDRNTHSETGGRKRKNTEGGQHITKKMKKVNKHLEQVMQEVKEAEAVYTTAQKTQIHSQTLHHLFVMLFRILKKTEATNPLIPGVLSLLARYAHLISIDYFTDLIKLLKELCATLESRGEGYTTIVHAVTTAFTMLDKVGHVLTDASGTAFLDLRDFYRLLYTVLGDIAFKIGWLEMPNQEEDGSGKRNQVELVCGAVQSMLQKKHQLNTERLTSFVKRLFTICLSTTPSAALLFLSCIDHPYIRKTPKIAALFEGGDGEERGGVNGGVYDGYMQDPDMTRVFSTSFWEIAALKNHYHPAVRNQVQSILSTKPKHPTSASRSKNANSASPFDTDGRFRVFPTVQVPATMQAKLAKKKKFKSGINLDGPTALYPSAFMYTLQDKILQD